MGDSLGTKKKKLAAKLKPHQRHAALLLVEKELGENIDRKNKKTMNEIGDEVGVSRQMLHYWKTQDPVFVKYMNILADEFLSSKQSMVYRKLEELIEKNGSVKAIELYLKMHNKLTERQELININSDGTQTDDDIAEDIAELNDLLGEDDGMDGNDAGEEVEN